MPFSQAEVDRYLGENFRTLAVQAKQTNIYAALMTGDPDAGGVEITGTGYARVAIPINDANWTAPATEGIYRYVSNVLAVTFGTPTGDWNGGLAIPWFALFSASSGGTRRFDGQLPVARTIVAGDDPPQFPPGTLRVKMSF
jgi:hypothetical protein